jgi:hypothetical protein
MFSVYKKIASPESSPVLSPIQSPIITSNPMVPIIDGDIVLDLSNDGGSSTITESGTDFLSTACNCCSSHRNLIARTITVQLTSDTATTTTTTTTTTINETKGADALLDQYINYSHSTHYEYRTYTPRGIQAFDDVVVQMSSK